MDGWIVPGGVVCDARRVPIIGKSFSPERFHFGFLELGEDHTEPSLYGLFFVAERAALTLGRHVIQEGREAEMLDLPQLRRQISHEEIEERR